MVYQSHEDRWKSIMYYVKIKQKMRRIRIRKGAINSKEVKGEIKWTTYTHTERTTQCSRTFWGGRERKSKAYFLYVSWWWCCWRKRKRKRKKNSKDLSTCSFSLFFSSFQLLLLLFLFIFLFCFSRLYCLQLHYISTVTKNQIIVKIYNSSCPKKNFFCCCWW